MSQLDAKNVPEALVSLLPMASKWGLGDDFQREEAIQRASTEELCELVASIDAIADEDLFGWLEGPESHSDQPTREYLAMTCLTMAIDSAKVRLRRMIR